MLSRIEFEFGVGGGEMLSRFGENLGRKMLSRIWGRGKFGKIGGWKIWGGIWGVLSRNFFE